MPHSHSGCCSHGADENESELGTQYSLYTKINLEEVQCLNEVVEGSGKTIFKPWERRLDTEQYVESDVDEELLFNIPFTGNVKLKGLIMIGGEEDTHPSKMRLFKNKPNLTFDDTTAEPDVSFEMQRDPAGCIEYPVKPVKFSSVYHLSIHIPKNFGADRTKVYYIGLRGEFTPIQRQAVTICTYESAPNIADHKVDIFNTVPHQIH